MIADFNVSIPIANVVKFTLDGANKDQRANFDQQSFSEADHAGTGTGDFLYPIEKTDPLRIQFYNNFPAVKLEILKLLNGQTTVVGTTNPSVAVNYLNKKYRSACKFSSINGKLFIFFDEGPEYTDEDFLIQGQVVELEGNLPNVRVVVGDNIRYKIGSGSFEFTEVVSIPWSPALEAQGFLTDADYSLFTPVDGLVEITYDEKPANLYAQSVDLSGLDDGCYKLKLSFGISAPVYSVSFTTEPLDIQIRHEKSLAVIYRHEGVYSKKDSWKYEYLNDWTNVIRLPSEFYNFEPAGEVETYMNDSGVPDVLRAVPYRQMKFTAFNIPSWLVDKLNVVFSHDTKIINGYHWENENFGGKDNIEHLDISKFEITLRQVEDRTLFTNDFTADVTAAFTPSSFTNIAFGGAIVTATFNSNTESIFRFQSLPAWITTDVEEFSNGDIVEFTIAANATFFNRNIQIVAISDDFDGLQTTIDFAQLYNTSTPLFIDVDDIEVALNGAAASNQLLNISSSGDYNIIISGAHSFTAAKESGFTQLRISEPTQNNGSTYRVGVVRLELIANPAIFIEIDVTQFTFRGMLSDPYDLVFADASGETIYAEVLTAPGVQWQASSADAWLSFDTSIQIDSVLAFPIFVAYKPPYIAPRSGSVVFFNVLNPGDAVTFPIFQPD